MVSGRFLQRLESSRSLPNTVRQILPSFLSHFRHFPDGRVVMMEAFHIKRVRFISTLLFGLPSFAVVSHQLDFTKGLTPALRVCAVC